MSRHELAVFGAAVVAGVAPFGTQRVGCVGLPTTEFIDRRGIVRKIRVGVLSRAVREDEVQRLLSR